MSHRQLVLHPLVHHPAVPTAKQRKTIRRKCGIGMMLFSIEHFIQQFVNRIVLFIFLWLLHSHLIQHLIHKWGYEAKDLIVDESKDDFEATRFAKTNSFFSTPQYAHLNALQFDGDGYDYSKPKRPAKAYSGPYVTNSKPLYIKQMKRR